MSELSFLSITEAAHLIDEGEISPVDLVTALLDRLEQRDRLYNSHITVCRDSALRAAQTAEREIHRGDRLGPLHGIPVSHKDICWTAGVRTTAHSKTMLDFVPTEDATFVGHLAERGMILLGKTNTTEFACGDMLEFGYTPNPWDLSRYAGASSSGSASAIAAGLALATTGTDTGGSIRFPASVCGIVGVKPTYGRVSRHGVVPLSWTMDTVGPMTRTVADAALMLTAMSGHDPNDPSSADEAVPDFGAHLSPRLDGLVLGIPEQHFYHDLEPGVDTAVRSALRQLEALGAHLEPVQLPTAGDLAVIGTILVKVEAFSQHAARLRERGHEYGTKARQRIAAGAYYSAADYLQALQLRTLWNRELAAAFAQVDALITPTLPFTAYPLSVQMEQVAPPDTSWGTRHFNLSGHPAMTVPCGFDADGLPVGLQIAAHAYDEATMFRVAHAYEQATSWHLERPEEWEVPRG